MASNLGITVIGENKRVITLEQFCILLQVKLKLSTVNDDHNILYI